MSDTKDEKPKMRPISDTDPRKRRLEAVASMIRNSPMPGKIAPEERGVVDASFEALAVEYGASLYPCFLCGKDVVEFAVWRALCDVDASCNMEFIRCRACDPNGSVTRDAWATHVETAHPEAWEPCPGCGVVALRATMRTMTCACAVEFTRCRERCDARALYEEHAKTHASGEPK